MFKVGDVVKPNGSVKTYSENWLAYADRSERLPISNIKEAKVISLSGKTQARFKIIKGIDIGREFYAKMSGYSLLNNDDYEIF